MNITTGNIEEWCFRYLEKDLNEEECTFFEKELKTNAALQKEYALWQKTKLTDLPLDIQSNINRSIYRFNAQFLWVLLEFTVVVALSVWCMCFISSTQSPASKIQQNQKIELIKENKTTEEQKNISENKTYILRNLEQNPNESIVVYSENLVVDSTLMIHAASEKQDSILPAVKKAILDTISSPKDSIERKVKPKTKTQKRKNYNGSRLIPINNDL